MAVKKTESDVHCLFGVGKVNALLDGARQLWHALLECILLVCAEATGQAMYLFNACNKSPRTSFRTVCKGYITIHNKPGTTATFGFRVHCPRHSTTSLGSGKILKLVTPMPHTLCWMISCKLQVCLCRSVCVALAQPKTPSTQIKASLTCSPECG